MLNKNYMPYIDCTAIFRPAQQGHLPVEKRKAHHTSKNVFPVPVFLQHPYFCYCCSAWVIVKRFRIDQEKREKREQNRRDFIPNRA